MSETLFFLTIGLFFLIGLLLWAVRGRGVQVNRAGITEVQSLLAVVNLDLPPRRLGERIFAPEDLDFVTSRTAPEIQRKFMQERKALAYSWLRQTRNNMGLLMEFHRKAVRRNAHLSAGLEFRLAFEYALFLFTYATLLALIALRGPFYARRVVVYAAGMADRFSYLSGHILVGMDPARVSSIKNSWSGRTATS